MSPETSSQAETADLVIGLTYYSPYVSGLTNVARDVAEGLAARGWKITVVTTMHDRSLPPEETINGVRVVRVPVLTQLGKGAISPGLTRAVLRTARRCRVLNLHLPLLEAGLIARTCRKPLVLTYHCDVELPPGALNAWQQTVVDRSSRTAMGHATAVVVSSDDYARHSRLWTSIQPAMTVIPPPCPPCPGGRPSYRDGDGFHVGFLGRIVAEKGLRYLIEGFQEWDEPGSRLLIGGDFISVAGGSVIDDLRRRIRNDGRIQLLGFVPEERLADLYDSIDVLALPSVNAFEAFGIVQVVAMHSGVPVLASNLPGVRVPVQQTGFGELVQPRDSAGIAHGLELLKTRPPDAVDGMNRAAELYDPGSVIDSYEALFQKAADETATAPRRHFRAGGRRGGRGSR